MLFGITECIAEGVGQTHPKVQGNRLELVLFPLNGQPV